MDPITTVGASFPKPHELFFQVGLVLLVVTFIWWSASAFIATYARRKGRSWNAMFIVGILTTPITSGTITTAIASTYHPDENVECPTCSTQIRFKAEMCSQCGQTLRPNKDVGQDIVNRTAKWNEWLKWVPLAVTIIGAIWVIAGLVQDDGKLTQSFVPLAIGWILLGIGASLWVIKHVRRKLADDLYFELVGE